MPATPSKKRQASSSATTPPAKKPTIVAKVYPRERTVHLVAPFGISPGDAGYGRALCEIPENLAAIDSVGDMVGENYTWQKQRAVPGDKEGDGRVIGIHKSSHSPALAQTSAPVGPNDGDLRELVKKLMLTQEEQGREIEELKIREVERDAVVEGLRERLYLIDLAEAGRRYLGQRRAGLQKPGEENINYDRRRVDEGRKVWREVQEVRAKLPYPEHELALGWCYRHADGISKRRNREAHRFISNAELTEGLDWLKEKRVPALQCEQSRLQRERTLVTGEWTTPSLVTKVNKEISEVAKEMTPLIELVSIERQFKALWDHVCRSTADTRRRSM
ncbi:hypothetical protein IAT38_007397 [Cryptococcus sp. DSM 104549]